MTVRNLFTTKQWRELELIALLTKSQKSLYYKDVCERLNCSLLTLQSCVDNSVFMDGIGQMTYEYSHFSITYKEECGLKEVYQKAMLESQSLQMMSLLFFKDEMTLTELANELFVSLSTLKRLIDKVNIYLKKEFDIKIITNPVQVVGEEYQIRLFYIKYFSEAYNMSEWPFGNLVNENNLGRLVSLMISKTDININFSMFRHIKILGGVNLIRYCKGFVVGESKGLSQIFLDLLKGSREMTNISQLFFHKHTIPLNETALSEVFSDYMSDELFLGGSFPTLTNKMNYIDNPRELKTWIRFLDKLEDDMKVMQPNKYEMARALHTTVILDEEDINRNFLIYNDIECYLAFFKKNYKFVYKKVMKSIKHVFRFVPKALSQSLLSNLIYTLLITWEDLFLNIGKTLSKIRLLVIEKSQGSVGSFLKEYIGDYFDITIYKKLTFEPRDLEVDFDIIVTDTVIMDSHEIKADIFYFSQLVPSKVAVRLNDYLRIRMGQLMLR